MTEEKFALALANMGLQLLRGSGLRGTPPLGAVWQLASCAPSERTVRTVPLDVPEFEDKFNAMWASFAEDSGLFGGGGEFLLIDRGRDGEYARWVEVRLMESWDIAGAGIAAGVTGFQPGYPEFGMSSPDGRTIMCGTSWSTSAGCIVMHDPFRSEALRSHVGGRYLEFDLGQDERQATLEWLRQTNCEAPPEDDAQV